MRSSGLKNLTFLPPNPDRKGEGGMRTKGCFRSIQAELGNSASTRSGGEPALPLVTVITVVFNGAATLENTITSVLGQTYKNIEFILIDGGSSDGTLEIIRKYEESIDYWVSETDKGIYDAWNKGVALSSGEWIAFLGSDDVYADDAIENYVSRICARIESPLEFVSGKALFIVPELGVRRVIGGKWNWALFQRYMNVAHVGSLHHRSLFEKYGCYDTSYEICGDYELLLRAQDKLQADFVDAITTTMRGGGISNTSLKVFQESMRAKVETGGRKPMVASLEKYVAIEKFFLRNFLYNIRYLFHRITR